MPPRTLGVLVAAVVTFAIAAGSATAQTQNAAPPDHPVQITPFFSIDGHGEATRMGAALSFEWTQKLTVEGEVTYGDPLRFASGRSLGASANLLYSLRRSGRLLPYVAGGVGFEDYGYLAVVPNGRNDIVLSHSELMLAVNAGGGLKIGIGRNWGLRTDARWVTSVEDRYSGHIRFYGGITFGAGRRSRSRSGPPSEFDDEPR